MLCCAIHPLTVQALIEGIAIELGDPPRYDPGRRLEDIDSIQQLCPGLTEVDIDQELRQTTIRIAHFSVREYLESDSIRHSKNAAFFSVKSQTANAQMACISLTALLEFSLAPIWPPKDPPVWEGIGIVDYASKAWPHHYRVAENDSQTENQLRRLLFKSPEFFSRRGLFAVISIDDSYPFRVHKGVLKPSPLHLASSLGLTTMVLELLKIRGADADSNLHLGMALQGASEKGHEDIVRILLDFGVSGKRGVYLKALEMASEQGHEKVAQLLVDKAANIGKYHGEALAMASRNGHKSVVKSYRERNRRQPKKPKHLLGAISFITSIG